MDALVAQARTFAMELVVESVAFHHRRIRTLGRAVVHLAGPLPRPPAWQPLLEQYDLLARPLGRVFHELEEHVYDPVQLLAAQGRLTFCALRASRPAFEQLTAELQSNLAALDALERALQHSDEDDGLTDALRLFCLAVREYLGFQRSVVRLALEPFFWLSTPAPTPEEHPHP
ncbi:MAG: hypothetical protein K1X89_16320 [Myxococcaceae bacterium]|nr:hypothetical protein [Myxococcaceae bacterium]